MTGSDFAGQRVLVTGSTRGIGRAAAELFFHRGAEVILHGRRGEDASRAAAALGAGHGRVSSLHGDLARREDCRRIAEAAGAVDVLVNCAGVFEGRNVEASDEAFWDATIAVNVTAAWLLAKALLPGLRERRGVIVNVASDSAFLGYPDSSVYCASKGALVGLTRALAVELAPEARVLAICPGPVATDMMDEAVRSAPDPAAARESWSAPTMLGRVASPEEIAEAIVFAASRAARFATGSAWLIDGGVTAGRRVQRD
ncbi:MAG: short-chain dehydrogenase/reductase [Rhodospirillales bacterium]|jgi:NAD(P)-dependent dehydrogenase (short-subunit alcohol dehydrogenase family)|nr:short-chain dehydrogenase/reductase [Rhodospirillales bacterium]